MANLFVDHFDKQPAAPLPRLGVWAVHDYLSWLQLDTPPTERLRPEGLQALLRDCFPVFSRDGVAVHFESYRLAPPASDDLGTLRRCGGDYGWELFLRLRTDLNEPVSVEISCGLLPSRWVTGSSFAAGIGSSSANCGPGSGADLLGREAWAATEFPVGAGARAVAARAGRKGRAVTRRLSGERGCRH